MDSKLIEKINEFSRIARERQLTQEEEKERQALREQYISEFKASMRATLENTYIENPDGTKVPLKSRKR